MTSREGSQPTPAPTRLSSEAASSQPREPSARWALDLLARAEPYQLDPGRAERVWQTLRVPRPRRPARLRWALAATALLACGIFASAALAGWPAWLARVLAVAPANPPALVPSPPRKAHPSPREEPAAVPPGLAPTEPVVAAPADASGAPARTRRVAKESAENTGDLLAAMRALRIEHNPARARSLLTAYLDRHPKGALAEEALVMLVEAAVAHRDSDAAALAGRYFKLYPNGPFRGQVERTLAAYGKP